MSTGQESALDLLIVAVCAVFLLCCIGCGSSGPNLEPGGPNPLVNPAYQTSWESLPDCPESNIEGAWSVLGWNPVASDMHSQGPHSSAHHDYEGMVVPTDVADTAQLSTTTFSYRPSTAVWLRSPRSARSEIAKLEQKHDVKFTVMAGLVLAQRGLTFSARGPFGPSPVVYDTRCPSESWSNDTSSTADMWKNKSFPLPVSMNPKPRSVNRLIVPSST